MEKNLIAQFELNIPKAAKSLAKFASKDEFRPQFCGVLIAPAAGYMGATDTHKLQIFNIEAVGECPENLQVMIDPAHIAKIAGKAVTVSEFEVGDKRISHIECDGETLVSEYRGPRIPDFRSVVSATKSRNSITLTADSLAALETICKLHKHTGIYFNITEGADAVRVYSQVYECLTDDAAYTLRLAAPAETTLTIDATTDLLAPCLIGCSGRMTFTDEARPLMFDGTAAATLLMPRIADGATLNKIESSRGKFTTANTSFAEDAAAVLAEMQCKATEYWREIIAGNVSDNGECKLRAGNYTAKEIADNYKAKCGRYAHPRIGEPLTISRGNIEVAVNYERLFELLTRWETVFKAKKTTFIYGI